MILFFIFCCIKLAELLFLVRQPKVLFSSFEFFKNMRSQAFVRNLEADDCSDFADETECSY